MGFKKSIIVFGRTKTISHERPRGMVNDSNGQAGPQGGPERGILAQIGPSMANLLAVRHTKELFVTGRPLKHTPDID